MSGVTVTCRTCKRDFIYDEPSPLHLSHLDKFIVCKDCKKNPMQSVFTKKYKAYSDGNDEND
tara:strand:- start:206 stop:391 length:186 start_codon:yes stop_codon:yes gene_type:complete